MNKIDSVEKKIAMMTENGFNEAEFITLQKAIMLKNAHTKIISSHIGLVYSNPKTGNGINYAVDHALSETLAMDYDCLIVVGGSEHIEFLCEEPHAIRLMRAFLRESMPILVVSEGSKLLDVIGDTRFSELTCENEEYLYSDSVFWNINGKRLDATFKIFFETVCSKNLEKSDNKEVAA